MLIHVLAILGLTASVIGWYLIQRYAFGPEGATACGKPKVGPSACESRWEEAGRDDDAR